MSEAKREILLRKLEDFEKELEKRRLSLLAVARITFTVLAIPGGLWASADVVSKLITNVMQTVAEAKAAEDETRQLPSNIPPKVLSPPRMPTPAATATGGFPDDLVDDVPF